MTTKGWHIPYRTRLVGKAVLSALLVCCLTDVACSQARTNPGGYDVTHRRLEQIPPGTAIAKEAPRGWTHLIIKSHTKPGEGDVNQLSPTAMRLSSLLFTAILADVQPDRDAPGRHRLARVAVGLGTSVGGKDVILTPETARRQGANLGLLGNVVLSKGQERLQDIKVVARSKTMAVFDSPGLIARERRHQPILLRYAVLVDPQSGKLETLLWALDRDGGEPAGAPSGPARLLPANFVEDCVLHVDGNEFSLGAPTEKAFAMTDLPRARKEVPFPDDLKGLAARPRFSQAMAAELEGKLRELLAQADR
jgi:hypothetical protein